MTNYRNGPPNEVGPREIPEGTDTTTPATTTTEAPGYLHSKHTGQQCGGDTVGAQLRRRRLASYRCEPLASGHRDPWQPWRPEWLSDKQLEGVAAAAVHLLDRDLLPLFDVSTLRQLWRLDRQLAWQLYELAGGDA